MPQKATSSFVQEKHRGKCEVISGQNLSHAVEALIVCLQDQDSSVRSSAAQALANIEDPRAMGPLVKALEDEDHMVRRCASVGLAAIGDTSCVPALKKLAETDPKNRDSIERAIEAIKKRESSEK